MTRCSCESTSATGGCLCIFEGGLNVTVTGGGTPSDPIVINVEPMYLEGVDGDNTGVVVTGTGDVSNPYIVNIYLDPALREALWTRWSGSRAEYDAIVTKSPTTLYVVIP